MADFKAYGWWRYFFAAIPGLKTFIKNLTMSPSDVNRGGQYDTKYQVCDSRVDISSGMWSGEDFWTFSSNQLVAGAEVSPGPWAPQGLFTAVCGTHGHGR